LIVHVKRPEGELLLERTRIERAGCFDVSRHGGSFLQGSPMPEHTAQRSLPPRKPCRLIVDFGGVHRLCSKSVRERKRRVPKQPHRSRC
jgi:hypothetical protein